MAVRYAKGDRAWGICQRCGQRDRLIDLVFDEQYPMLRVHVECFDFKHPQERLHAIHDPVSLWRPSPEDYPMTAPVLDADQATSLDPIIITWTAASSPVLNINGYRLYRSVNDGAYTLVTTLPVIRDDFGAITTETLTYTDNDAYVDGDIIAYYVVAYSGLESEGQDVYEVRSNIDAVTITGGVFVPSADVRWIATENLILNTISPDYLLDAHDQVFYSAADWSSLSATRDMLIWVNNNLFWVTGYGSSNAVYYSLHDGTGQGIISGIQLPSEGNIDFFPYSVKAVVAGNGEMWLGGFLSLGSNQLLAGIAPFDGVTNPGVDVVFIPDYNGPFNSQVFDTIVLDGGLNVLAIVGWSDFPGDGNPFGGIYNYEVGTDTWTKLIESAATGGSGGVFVQGASGVLLAVTSFTIFRSTDNGANWTETATPWGVSATAPRCSWGSVNGTDIFVAVLPESEVLYYSTDGITWTTVTPGLNFTMIDVVVVNDLVVFVGYDTITGESLFGYMHTHGTLVISSAGDSVFAGVAVARRINYGGI